ncbi:hypothetical protein ACFL6X_07485, partial [Candidatus Latescibacterota bacterium]
EEMDMGTIRDRLWIWGHEAGSHNDSWNLSGTSRMTPLEGAAYLGIPNLIMVGYRELPRAPFDQYAIPFRPLQQVVWSIVGASGATEAAERAEVVRLAAKEPNITGVMMDDFFHEADAVGEVGVLSVQDLEGVRRQLAEVGRPLDLWVVLYNHHLHLPVADHLARCDVVSFWTWEAPDLEELEANLARVEDLAPHSRRVLGCYLWDYGRKQAMPVEVMKRQCETGLAWLRDGRIDGLIFLASCICDLELETVEWARRWIGEVADELLPTS